MKYLNDDKGITMIALIVTIIVLMIIAGISITGGRSLINISNAESIETNMLTIKAKAKEYIENVDSKNWASKDSNSDEKYNGFSTKEGKNRKELTGDKYQLTLIEDKTLYSNYSNWYEDGYTYYALGKQALDKMDLSDLYEEERTYIIRYPLEDGDTKNLDMDIIYANGVLYRDVTYFNLSELEKVL